VDNSCSQSTIDSIPIVPLTEALASGKNCVICLEDFEEGSKAKKLGCGHYFHPECIDRWLKISGTCPMCKEVVGRREEEGGEGGEGAGAGGGEGGEA